VAAAEAGADAEERIAVSEEAKDAAPNIQPVEEAEQAAEASGAGARANADAMTGTQTGPVVSGGERTPVVTPEAGESVMEGTVRSWAKAVVDEVELDETLLELSTDKVDSEEPSPAKGFLAEILVHEGETVEVGEPIAVIATSSGASVGTAPAPAVRTDAPTPAEKGYGMAGDGSATRSEERRVGKEGRAGRG